jgi:hypothetical protein
VPLCIGPFLKEIGSSLLSLNLSIDNWKSSGRAADNKVVPSYQVYRQIVSMVTYVVRITGLDARQPDTTGRSGHLLRGRPLVGRGARRLQQRLQPPHCGAVHRGGRRLELLRNPLEPNACNATSKSNTASYFLQNTVGRHEPDVLRHCRLCQGIMTPL